MKQKHNGGYSLIEVLVAIVLLGIFVAPTCSSLVMGYRMNSKADQLLDAQLAVSSAVETLMAEGIREGEDYTDYCDTIDEDLEVTVDPVADKPYYNVEVTCGDVTVKTTIRKAGG